MQALVVCLPPFSVLRISTSVSQHTNKTKRNPTKNEHTKNRYTNTLTRIKQTKRQATLSLSLRHHLLKCLAFLNSSATGLEWQKNKKGNLLVGSMCVYAAAVDARVSPAFVNVLSAGCTGESRGASASIRVG